MIKVQDWIASIPDEEKHIAYVGEGLTERRVFYLTGGDWEKYRNWTFHLDMAFDPESETTRDSRQVVQTTKNYKKTASETGISTEEVTTKETFAVDSETVDADGLTDVATLTRRVMDDGIQLTWTVLRQQTQYPGKLWATIRAMGESTDEVKKSAVMVFEVDPAVSATPAKPATVNEFQQMEANLNVYYRNAMNMLDSVNVSAESAHSAASGASWYADQAAQSAAQVEQSVATVLEAVDNAQSAEKAASADATAAAEHRRVVVEEADAAKDACATAKAYMLEALVAAQDAADSYIYAEEEAVKCEEYVQQCADHVRNMTTAVDNLFYNRVNVRDYGAVGDGVTDDRAAIIAAFDKAKKMLPCEVYFPAGVYGISNGITVEMAYGTGGLRVCGAGRDVTTIQYLESYDPDQVGNMWYAIRIWPVGMPSVKPTKEEEYLHDISYSGLTVYDTDPIAHAWNPEKGDPNKEETHGFDIHFCKRVSVTDCNIIQVGDEGIDICGCHDVVVMNNHLIGSPAAGTAGGAISIGDGCRGVVVSGNTVNGSAADETLADGTVLRKRNFGIAVESLLVPVSDVVISDNIIQNVQGVGINIGATNSGSSVDRIVAANNLITDCNAGIRVMETTYAKRDVSLVNNTICRCYGDADSDGYAIYTGSKTYALMVVGNRINNIGGLVAVRIVATDHALVTDNLFQDIQGDALRTSGDVTVRNCTFVNIGLGGGSAQAVQKLDSASYRLTVDGCRMTGICSSVGIRNADVVENTDIEFVNNGTALASKYLKRLVGGRLNGIVTLNKAGALMRDVTIEANTAGNHAVTIANSGISVIGCHITIGSGKKAIIENDGCVNNIVAHNMVDGNLNTGSKLIVADNEGTICVNNMDLRLGSEAVNE